MRVRGLALLFLLMLIGCRGTVRHEGFAMAGPDAFLYSAHTNTVITANDDGRASAPRLDRRRAQISRHVPGRLCHRHPPIRP